MNVPIQTALGEISNDSLGYCQIHEHIFVLPTPASEKNPALCIDDEAKSLAELRDYKAANGRAILDAQPYGAGRCAEILPELSAASGVHIIASTGFHLFDYYPAAQLPANMSDRELVELYAGECTQGARHSKTGALLPFRTGAVKAALPKEGAAGEYKRLLLAAGIAARDANKLLFIHTEAGEGALEALRLLKPYVPASQVMVCHADRREGNFELHEVVADTGAYLDYDTIGRFKYHGDQAEIELIAHMVKRGYQKQLLLALDTTAQRLFSYGGSIGLTYIKTTFLPMLKGVIPDDAIIDMTVKNAARALTPAM